MPPRAVFLDRDGTINVDPGYLNDPDKVVLYPGVGAGIKALREDKGFKIIVISNQSGISRGLITEKEVDDINNRINDLLKEFDTKIDAFYYCPYHPDYSPEELCVCRKPSPYMVVKAAGDFQVNLKESYLIGDRFTDIECGINAGVKTVLIKNELSDEEINSLHNQVKSPNFVANNFEEATNFIIRDYTGGT